MPPKTSNRPTWLVVGAAALVTGVAGFGLSQLTAKKTPMAAESPAADEAAKTSLTLPDAYLQQANIGVEDVSAGSLAGEIRAPGTVMAAPSGEAIVVARASGTIVSMTRRLGDAVRAGEVIAQVDSLDAATMAADRSVAATKATQAHAVLARETKLFEQGVTSRQDFEAAQAAANVADAEARRASSVAQAAHVSSNGRSVSIVSPISGRITTQTATLGGYVTPDSELFRIADDKLIQVEAAVPASDARKIQPGDSVTVSFRDTTLAGTVRSVTPTVNVSTGAATVVVTLSGNTASLVPGEGVQVRVNSTGAGTTGIVIPEEAVQVIGGKDVVFVKTAKGFQAQPVLVASRSAGRAEITSGLQSGQGIATRNAFLLKAELTKSVED